MTDSHPIPQILPVEHAEQDRPFWSVMIPTYNARFDFLKESLESILVQGHGPERMQIEVVDDCSTVNDVVEMVHRIAGERISVSKTPQNLGLAGCWNLCIEKSRGHWVHILHQDDSVLPGFYDRYESAISKHSDIALIASRSFLIDGQGIINNITQRIVSLENCSNDASGLYYYCSVQCPSVVVKRCAYEALGGFRNDLKYTLDVEMWLRIISEMGGIVLHDILSRYRECKGNESSRLWHGTAALADEMHVGNILAGMYADYDLSQARRIMWKNAMRVAESCAKNNDLEVARAIRKYARHNLPFGVLLRCEASQILRRIAMLLGLNQSY